MGAILDGSMRCLRAFVDGIARIPLVDQPGEKYNYSFSFDVLGRVLEVITGKSLDKVLQERVFNRLGMHDTWWAVPDRELSRLAACYSGPASWKNLYGSIKGMKQIKTRLGLVRIDGNTASESHWRQGQQCRVLSGGGFMGYLYGGLVSTVTDTARFVRMLLDYGKLEDGTRLLKKSTVLAMEKNRLRPSDDAGRVCYLGNMGTFRDGAQGEFGMGGAACTYWNVDREDEIGTVWFTQPIDMPEFSDVKGVDPKKADLWGLLHKAVLKGSKSDVATGSCKKRRSPVGGTSLENKRPKNAV